MSNPFRYFNSSPEVIRLVVMMYVRFPLSLRNVVWKKGFRLECKKRSAILARRWSN
jgi:hypothetical protein